MALKLNPKVLKRVNSSSRPRLRFRDGRFAPLGAKRNPKRKGTSRHAVNAKTTMRGDGVEQIRAKVRKSTGSKTRELGYAHIFSPRNPTRIKAVGKAKGDSRRMGQTAREAVASINRNMAAKSSSANTDSNAGYKGYIEYRGKNLKGRFSFRKEDKALGVIAFITGSAAIYGNATKQKDNRRQIYNG